MILLIGILVAPLMLLIGGLAIDVSAYGQRDAKLQVCADAMVLASASATYWVEPEPPATEGHWETPLAPMHTYHQLNCAGATLEAPTVVGQPPEVGVVLRSTYDASLLRLIGLDHLNLAAGAKAVRINITEEERPQPGRSALVR